MCQEWVAWLFDHPVCEQTYAKLQQTLLENKYVGLLCYALFFISHSTKCKGFSQQAIKTKLYAGADTSTAGAQ